MKCPAGKLAVPKEEQEKNKWRLSVYLVWSGAGGKSRQNPKRRAV
jgi:hypothetical protein